MSGLGFDPTSLLKDWGFSLTALAIIAMVATLVFIFSLREFAYWFLRINKILENQKLILERLGELEKSKATEKQEDVFPLPEASPKSPEFKLYN
jgi:hypothetical protein